MTKEKLLEKAREFEKKRTKVSLGSHMIFPKI